MKEEMQGFQMNPKFEIFISEKALLNHLYTFKPGAPGNVTILCLERQHVYWDACFLHLLSEGEQWLQWP